MFADVTIGIQVFFVIPDLRGVRYRRYNWYTLFFVGATNLCEYRYRRYGQSSLFVVGTTALR